MLGKIIPAVALGGGVALLWPELSLRAATLQLVTADVASLQSTTTFKEAQVKHADLLKNCEDAIVLEEEGVAILSCDAQRDAWNTVMGTFIDPTASGTLFQWYYTDPDAFPQPLSLRGLASATDFHPLGIDYHRETSTLFVVNHASSPGSVVDIFDYVPWNGFGTPAATHRARVAHPGVYTPNSIHALNGSSFLVTNDHFFRARDQYLLQKLETYAALPGGSVVQVTLPDPLPEPEPSSHILEEVEIKPRVLGPDALAVKTVASNIPFANGLALLNGSTLAVASTGARSVRLYDYAVNADGEVELGYRAEARAPAMLDNLSVDSQGRLLAAGHPRPGALTATVAFRAGCLQLRAKAEAIALAAAAEADEKLAAAARLQAREEAGDQKLGEDAPAQKHDPKQAPLLMATQEELIEAAIVRDTLKVVLPEQEQQQLERCAVAFDDTAPSWVGELLFDGEGQPAGWKEVYVGTEYGSSCTAVRDAKEGLVLVVGLYERGLLVGRE